MIELGKDVLEGIKDIDEVIEVTEDIYDESKKQAVRDKFLKQFENLNRYTKFERIFGIGYFKKKYNFNMIFHSFSEIQHILKYFARNKKRRRVCFTLFFNYFSHIECALIWN